MPENTTTNTNTDGTSVSAKQEYRRGLHNFQRYKWNGKIPSPQPLPAKAEDVG